MARFATANVIINRAAVEVGLYKSNNPVASDDETFVQLTELLNAAGQEMVELWPWQGLVSQLEIITSEGDTGVYDLPSDFSYLTDQTGWDRTNNVPLGGPLSAQDWNYLQGRDLVSSTIYASFRQADNKLELFPQPPPADHTLTWEYISRNWVSSQAQVRADYVSEGSDIVLYEPILMVKFLRLKFLGAKGMDTQAALTEFETMFNSRTGKDTGAAVLNASNTGRAFPYLNGYWNVGDTGYGLS